MAVKRAPSFAGVIAALRKRFGLPKPQAVTDPFELILLENVAYLGTDERRKVAFGALKSRVGTSARAIAAASDATLLSIAKLAGIMPEMSARKLRKCADIALWLNGGDLRSVVHGPAADAKKALKKFPGIGDPGVEKIMLFSGAALPFALESNGVRVLTRLGYATELKDYAKTYRSVQRALATQRPKTRSGLVEAYELLRQHGRELCKRTNPRCPLCPLKAKCAYYVRMNSTAG